MVAEIKQEQEKEALLDDLMEDCCPKEFTKVQAQLLRGILAAFVFEGEYLIAQSKTMERQFHIADNFMDRVGVSHPNPRHWVMLETLDYLLQTQLTLEKTHASKP